LTLKLTSEIGIGIDIEIEIGIDIEIEIGIDIEIEIKSSSTLMVIRKILTPNNKLLIGLQKLRLSFANSFVLFAIFTKCLTTIIVNKNNNKKVIQPMCNCLQCKRKQYLFLKITFCSQSRQHPEAANDGMIRKFLFAFFVDLEHSGEEK
jgi:hypothetical protein